MAVVPPHQHEREHRAEDEGDQQQHAGETEGSENDVTDRRFRHRLAHDPHDVGLRILLHGCPQYRMTQYVGRPGLWAARRVKTRRAYC